MALYVLLALIAVLISVFIIFSKKKFSYWSDRGIKGPMPWPLVGNFGNVILQKESVNQCVKDVHLKYAGEKLVGLYRGFEPILLVRDPELAKRVLVKDFNVFQDRGMSASSSKLSKNLFSADGKDWKVMRQKMTPIFTSRKLKDMIPLIQEGIHGFIEYVQSLVDNNIDHEIRALTAKYTLEVIGSCGFGLDLDAFSDTDNEFRDMSKKIFTPSTKTRVLAILDMIIPGIRKLFVTSNEIQDFFLRLVRKVMKDREGKSGERRDFMDLMIELKEQGKVTRNSEEGTAEIKIDEYMMAAQALVFYAAGFETSAATMSFMFHELALNTDIQDRVYEDICQAAQKHNGQINYESIKDMRYLEMVFDETLRKYSVAGILFRKSTEEYTFPGTNLTIPKGMPVMISASALNADPEYFQQPEKFNPENFSPENLQNIPPCVYLPFGEGPRNCIGMRFAKVQSMLGAASFLRKFKLEPSAKTQRVLDYDPKRIVLVTKCGIWLKISERQSIKSL